MFDKQKFSEILVNIISKYDSLRDFSNTSGFNRTSVSKYTHKELNNPPSPSKLKDIANASKGIVTYEELMKICDYIDLKDIFYLRDNEPTNLFMANIEDLLTEYKFSENDIVELAKISNSSLPDSEKYKKISNILSKYSQNIVDKFMLKCRKQKAIISPTLNNKGVKIPVLGKVVAGQPIEAVEDILGYETITKKLAETGEFFCLVVNGNSMEPSFFAGDIVVIRKQPDVENGDIAVVLVNGNDATIKKIIKNKDGIILQPINPTYEPIFYTNEQIQTLPVQILGKVMENRRKYY